MFEGYIVVSPLGTPMLSTLALTESSAKAAALKTVVIKTTFEKQFRNYEVKKVKVTFQ